MGTTSSACELPHRIVSLNCQHYKYSIEVHGAQTFERDKDSGPVKLALPSAGSSPLACKVIELPAPYEQCILILSSDILQLCPVLNPKKSRTLKLPVVGARGMSWKSPELIISLGEHNECLGIDIVKTLLT